MNRIPYFLRELVAVLFVVAVLAVIVVVLSLFVLGPAPVCVWVTIVAIPFAVWGFIRAIIFLMDWLNL